MRELIKKFYLDKFRILLLVRYAISGVIGIFVQTSILFVWVSVLGLRDQYLVGSMVGLLVALCVAFTLQKYWTFRDMTHHTVHIQFAMYAVIALINLALNTALLHLSKIFIDSLGLNFFHVWYLICQVIVLGFVAAVSFFANYFFTFRTHTRGK
jgi:putative flippase GtrA